MTLEEPQGTNIGGLDDMRREAGMALASNFRPAFKLPVGERSPKT